MQNLSLEDTLNFVQKNEIVLFLCWSSFVNFIELVDIMNYINCFSIINPLDADILSDSVCEHWMSSFHMCRHENNRFTVVSP